MISDIFATAFVMALWGMIFGASSKRATAQESQLILGGYLFHVLCGLAIVVITSRFYGGDVIGYHRFGVHHAELLRQNFTYYAPDLVRLVFKLQPQTLDFTFAGASTGSMQGIATWMMFFLGDSLYAGCMFLTMTSMASELILYDVFKRFFPKTMHQRLMLALLFMPSVGFWASGLLKESVAFAAMGPALWGGMLMLRRRYVSGLIIILASMFVISLVKAYILFPMVMASGVAYYWYRALTKHGKVALLSRPLQLIFYGLITVGAVIALGKLFPKYSVDNIAEEAANLQYYGQRRAGTNSNYVVGDYQQKSLSQQIFFMPIGLVFSLFRPLPFEIRNAAILLNVIEMIVLYWLWFKVITQRGWRANVRMITGHPLLMFCLVFVVLFGASVGISTTNVGTLSRYRMPMMPFYAVLLAILSAPAEQKRPKPRKPAPRRLRAQPPSMILPRRPRG